MFRGCHPAFILCLLLLMLYGFISMILGLIIEGDFTIFICSNILVVSLIYGCISSYDE
jgi:hypothetical protein